jgi:WD40 repeat protein
MLLDLSTWDVRARLKGHCQGVMALAFSPDGKSLASGGGRLHGNGDIFLWDVASGNERAHTSEPFDWIKSLVFTPDGKILISGGGIRELRGEIRFWDEIQVPIQSQVHLPLPSAAPSVR